MSLDGNTSTIAVDSSTIADISTAMWFLSTEHSTFSINLRRLWIESLFFGIYSALIISSFSILIRSSTRSMAKMFVMVACLLMYLSAVAHYGLSFQTVVSDNDDLRCNINAISTSIENIQSSAHNSSWPDTPVVVQGFDTDCLTSIPLVINIILSDAIVAWRVCVVWPHSKAIRLSAVILILATIVFTSLSTTLHSCNPFPDSPARLSAEFKTTASSVGTEFVDSFGSVAMILSWITNLSATFTLAYKAWIHRMTIRDDLRRGSSRTYAEKVMLLFIESGTLYFALWALVAFADFAPETPAGLKLAVFVMTLKACALIHLIGMYPTLLIILVSFTKTYTEPELSRHAVIDPHTHIPRP
ncbi:hypothetical protein PHLGIDRAFT_403080 [Phlebiopsis gigantea 11061_1 CR5-6]|uniref:G-protein coupled receptors family 1 profile domain-containing protein n=1 Tax=Phlebiopsis gigantea (strain 11061_1 CR5-6) TaxID=745531 RepID=A0A0C3NRV0_PHLG1|nr:hypothetical protein PHLGIDRAFT_403080 [Phlebiopsis gigantea 11061_1 CR5-6]